MKLFYKSESDFFYGDSSCFMIPQAHGPQHLGIDGSTTSFGVSYTAKDHTKPVVWMGIREEESHDEFFSLIFPMISGALYNCQIETATYEKTPNDFEKNTHSFRVMKNTEKAVGKFLTSGAFLDIKHKFNIYDIFPNSWKAFLVKSDPSDNFRKVHKRKNSVDILTTLDMCPDFWLNEASEIKGHSYDAFEALGICAYGSRFVHRGAFTTTYRNFKKRRPLAVWCKQTSWDTFAQDAKQLKGLFGNVPMSLMVPNEHHSFMENLYALDADDRVNIMLVSPSEYSELHLYYKLITGMDGLLMLSVTRSSVEQNSFQSFFI